MVTKTKKTKKSVGQRGQTNHGWGARKKHKGSGHRGGVGMAGTGKMADQKKTLINKLYGNKYFGKQGVTSRGTKRKKDKVINLKEIKERFGGKREINLSKYKILGDGEIERAVTIIAKGFTKSAREKVEKAGGKVITTKTENSQNKKAEQKREEHKETSDTNTNKVIENKKEEK